MSTIIRSDSEDSRQLYSPTPSYFRSSLDTDFVSGDGRVPSNATQAARELDRITRIFEISKATGPLRPAKKRFADSLKQLLTKIEDVEKNPDLDPKELREKRENIFDDHVKGLSTRIQSLYLKEGSIEKRIEKLKEDILLADNHDSPVRFASEGLKSLTLISGYNGIDSSGKSKKIGHVIKTVDMHEPFCNEVYESFFRAFLQQKIDPETGKILSYGILIPSASSIDMKRKQCEGINVDSGKIEEIESKIKYLAEYLKADPSKGANHEALMFQEKVAGVNFYDFIKTSYVNVPGDGSFSHRFTEEQRSQFFHYIGRLYELDQWFGNLDRLGNAMEEEDSYSAKFPTSNAGNIMIEIHNNELTLWAIDNEIFPELLVPGKDDGHNKKYCSYLKNRLENADTFNQHSMAMILSLHEDIKEHISLETEVAKKSFAAFSKDLGIYDSTEEEKGDFSENLKESLAFQAITEGRKYILKALQELIIPNWHKNKESLKEELKQRYSKGLCDNFFEAQSQRFSVLSEISIQIESLLCRV